MKCPHCLIAFHYEGRIRNIFEDQDGAWSYDACNCPTCGKMVMFLSCKPNQENGLKEEIRMMAYPRSASRSPVPRCIPTAYASDYLEACRVLSDSPKASAALSRRCLQALLHDKVNVKKRNLDEEIKAVIESGRFPSHIAESLDAIRKIGNFAAHPIKSQSSGEIIEVAPGEAEWTLDVLESLFDFLFVQPAITREKREALDAKLAEAEKPLPKSPNTSSDIGSS